MASTPLNVWGGAARYTAPTTTSTAPTIEWTPAQKQQLADAYSAVNPTWTPTKDAASVTVNPTTFSPYADPNFLLGAAGIEQNKLLAQGNFTAGTGTAGPQNFGYTADMTDGAVNGHVSLQDASAYGYNPYNQAAQLQRSYDQSKRGTTNSYAASGQLYAGSLVNAQKTNDYNFDRSSDSLKRTAAGYYEGLQTNLDAANGGKYTQSILDALNSFLKGQQ